MQYVVCTVRDGELPEGVDMVIVERNDDALPVLILGGMAARYWRCMRAWEADYESATVPSVLQAVG